MLFKFLKGSGGVAIAYIYLTITKGNVPGVEQITQFQTNILLVNQIFLAVGIITGAWHAFWDWFAYKSGNPQTKADAEVKSTVEVK
jgi:hypothetical protein